MTDNNAVVEQNRFDASNSKHSSQDIADVEIKLFMAMIDPELRGIQTTLVRLLPWPEAFSFIPNAWQKALESVKDGVDWELSSYVHDSSIGHVEKGILEGGSYVAPPRTIEDAEMLATILRKHYFTAKLVNAISSVAEEASTNVNETDYDPLTLVKDLQTTLEDLERQTNTGESMGLGVGHDHKAIASAIFDTQQELIIPTGIAAYDDKAGGLAIGEQIIVACPTSSGKTLFLNQLAINMGLGMKNRQYVLEPQSTLCISLEMSEKQMWARILANLCGIDVGKFRRPELFTPEERVLVEQTLEDLSNYLAHKNVKFTLKGASTADIQGIRTELATHPYKIVMVDYLNLMAEGDALWSEMGAIARALKILAQRRGFVCLTAAQLDEDSLKIRYSRMVKEHCDTVLLWTLTKPEGSVEDIVSAYTEIFVDKGRSTGKFSFWVHFNFRYMTCEGVNPSQQLGMYSQAPQGGQLAPPLPTSNSIGVVSQPRPMPKATPALEAPKQPDVLMPTMQVPAKGAEAMTIMQQAAPLETASAAYNAADVLMPPGARPVDPRKVAMPGSIREDVLTPNFQAVGAVTVTPKGKLDSDDSGFVKDDDDVIEL